MRILFLWKLLDTGAAISVASEESISGLSHVQLEQSCAKLRSFTGQAIPVIGIVSVDVKNQQQLVKNLNLVIVQGHVQRH